MSDIPSDSNDDENKPQGPAADEPKSVESKSDEAKQGGIDDILNAAKEEPEKEKEKAAAEAEAIQETLNQSAIDSLLTEAIDESAPSIVRSNGVRFPKDQQVTVDVYDFLNPIFLTEVELRQIRIRNEQFVHYLSARLSMALRMDFSMKMSQLTTTTYTKFVEAIPNPSYISLFSINQKNGVGILSMNSRLALTIVNRLLGGTGHSVKDERYLTEIEIALMEDMVHIILEKWCQQWKDIDDISAALIGVENNGRFLQTSPPDSIVLVLSVESSLGDCAETMQIGVPYYAIEPIIKKIHDANAAFTEIKRKENQAVWREAHSVIQVPVVAEWNAFDITLRDLLNLRAGDVLEFPKDMCSKTQIRFQNATQFEGEVGVQNGHVAVKITGNKKDK